MPLFEECHLKECHLKNLKEATPSPSDASKEHHVLSQSINMFNRKMLTS